MKLEKGLNCDTAQILVPVYGYDLRFVHEQRFYQAGY